jgi:hypothetical protein
MAVAMAVHGDVMAAPTAMITHMAMKKLAPTAWDSDPEGL